MSAHTKEEGVAVSHPLSNCTIPSELRSSTFLRTASSGIPSWLEGYAGGCTVLELVDQVIGTEADAGEGQLVIRVAVKTEFRRWGG
jgi:hypothetical protein